MEPKGGRAESIALLPRASEAAITKVPGQCVNTPPAGTARERTPLSYTVVLLFMFRPRRMPPDGGLCLCYIRDEARSARQRSVSSVKTMRRLIQLTPFTRRSGILHCAERVGGQPRNKRVVACWVEKNKTEIAGHGAGQKKSPYSIYSVKA